MITRFLLLLCSAITLCYYTVHADFTTAHVPVAAGPQEIAVNKITNKIYTVSRAANGVSVIDGATLAATFIPTGSGAIALAINETTNRIYVANGNANTLSVIDGASGSVIANLIVGSFPTDVAVNPVTNRIYVANGSLTNGSISVIDGSTHQVTNIPADSGPSVIGVNPVTNKIYLGHASGTVFGEKVTVLDGQTNVTAVVPTSGDLFTSMAINTMTNRVYIGSFSGGSTGLIVINGLDNSVSAIPTGRTPRSVTLDEGTNKIYAACSGSNQLSVIDGATGTVTNVATGTLPAAVDVNPVTKRIYVGKCGDACGGGTSSSSLNIFSGTNNALISNAAGQTGPQWIAINPKTNRTYVSNRDGSSVSVIVGDDISITGRVLTPSGLGLRSATVRLQGPDGIRTATTSSFGIFNFAGVITSSSYLITVASKRYRFAPVNQSTGNSDIVDLDLVGLE